MLEDDKNYVVCNRVKDHTGMVSGMTEEKCHLCGETVLISPATSNIKKDRCAQVVCLVCAGPYINSGKPSVQTCVTQEQEDEFVRSIVAATGMGEIQARKVIKNFKERFNTSGD